MKMKISIPGIIGAATLASAALLASMPATVRAASENAGRNQPSADQPFTMDSVATFEYPWAIAFLPDGRLLVTEKPGKLFITTQKGEKKEVAGIPKVYYSGQNGLLDVAVSPAFSRDHSIYLTFVEPGRGGGALALARAQLRESGGAASLANLAIIWRQNRFSSRGQPGGIIAFPPDGRHLFLTTGDRQQPRTAQDPDLAQGKVLRLNLDGSTPKDNPMAGQGGVKAQTWTTGHRNPYGLAFAPDGRLWLDEMGPRGGDELNLIQPGRNYGWPVVSNGDNYNGTPIPRHGTHPEFEAPVVYWTPVIAPAGLAFYEGAMFPAWRGSALIGGLVERGLVRIAFDGKGGAKEAERWVLGHRIRDVAVASDGAVWLIEDEEGGRLLRLTPR
ncbi:MAG TPA: PQQ-dependent sugar dehydrogenase [Eoetvoesiella sp.]|jgi:glucose/arabinose dehydrogenase|uniref:PQQ-dependent sugar dehydrogenase n=1 Tax=Eoetvoesiella sp. TaxID=1966355 RepID=UPI002C826C47|nr:PQQ-dependent sugar dehydrogenase [Eoetvoesiella sp.]HWK61028.1 PQQ-dependent sugar dehydrogenase [Eoetvoesiella sp.]